MIDKVDCGNIIDSRWVDRWKMVDGVRVIKSRLCVRGFKDLQGSELATFSGTASRFGQRMINVLAASMGWTLWSADAGCVFLRGLTFEEIAKMSGEPLRRV